MIVVLCLTLVSTFNVPESITKTDIALESLLIAETVIDIANTHYVLSNGLGNETNQFLGAHPNRLKLYGLASAAILGHAFVAWLLPHPLRTAWQSVFVVIEGYVVASNYYIEKRSEVGFKFSF